MHGTLPADPGPPPSRVPLVLRLALREMRSGLRGFAVFIACIALGVGAIVGVAAVARSLVDGVGSQGRTILGGDASFSLVHREAGDPERDFLRARGTVSSIATLRAMASAPEAAALVELKAVDGSYPSVGELATEPAGVPADLLAERDGAFGGVADPVLLVRLDLKPGDRVTVGSARIELRARLVSEPDKIANGVGFGPRLLVSQEALRASGLIQPGSLVRWTYRLLLPPGRDDDAAVEGLGAAASREVPEAGWEVRTRLNADPRFNRNIERFSQFLTLIGLAALLVGGVGVANAVTAYVDRKRAAVGVLKSLGATGGRVVAIYLVQVGLIALVGIAGGIAVGGLILGAAVWAAAVYLPIPLSPSVSVADLGLAVVYGLLTALAFSVLPLGRAHDVPVSELFRDRVAPGTGRPRLAYAAVAALSGLLLVVVAVATAQDRRIALIFIAAAAGVFGLLRLVAAGITAGARRLPHAPNPSVRLAIANLHRPGALTPSLVLSLGVGITLLVTVAAIDGNLRAEIERTLPERAPSFFFIDVPSREADAFRTFLADRSPGASIDAVPMMRGRITALKDVPVAQIKTNGEAAWVLDGDRGITYSRDVPEGSTVAAGEWWPAEYRGPPLVSFDRDAARNLGLGVGDSVEVNVLGRTLTARIANLRQVDWRRLGIGFVMVFSPNTFAGAPHTQIMTITPAPGGRGEGEPRLMRDIARDFPQVTSVRVKDALEAASQIVGQLAFAIRAASGVALVASVLVLAGALAAGHRARVYDAVVLKTLGATRGKLLGAYLVEYGTLGLLTALFGLVAGLGAAFYVVTRIMRIGFAPDLWAASAWALSAVAVAVVVGLAGTWRILGQKPAPYLRSL